MKDQLTGNQQTILDILRILAAYAVLLGHSFSFYQITVFKDQEFFPYIQNIGVVIFFLLAGFLSMCSIKNKSMHYSFTDYVKHKMLRIYKEYLPGLILIGIIDYVSTIINGNRYGYYNALTVKQFIGNLCMLQGMGPENLLGKAFIPFGSGRPLWTLSVEWWLYMLFGWIALELGKQKTINAPKVIVLMFCVFMCSNFLIGGRGGGLGFVFLLGVFSFYCFKLIDIKVAKNCFIIASIAYGIYGLIIKEAYTVYSFIILWVILCCVLKLGERAKQDNERNKILAFLSKSTFMLYLLHYSVIDFIYTLNVSWCVQTKFWIGILVSVLTSCIMYSIFGKENLLVKKI